MDLKQELQKGFDILEKRIADLEKIRDEKFKTNGQFRYNPTNSYSGIDITKTQNREELIHIHSFITTKSVFYRNSAEELKLPAYPVFKWLGYSADDWRDDIALRFKILDLDTELNKARQLQEKVRPHLPEENTLKQLLLELNN